METFLEQENTSKHTNSHQGDDIIGGHGASQIVLYAQETVEMAKNVSVLL